jgi:RimJ/RimL family protein N-acetyltransferase
MLKGNRVFLRAIQREDLERLWDVFGEDLDIQSRVSDRPPVPRSRARLLQEFEREPAGEQRAARFVIEVDGQVVGRCELHGLDHYSRRCEIGIAIGRAYWGCGYGQDAVRVLAEYGFRHLNMHKIELEVLADDERAVGAYRKAGFVEEGRLREHAWHDDRHCDVLVMGLLRGDVPPMSSLERT